VGWKAPLDEYFRLRILEPLRMADTFYNVPADKQTRLVATHHRGPDGITVEGAGTYEQDVVDLQMLLLGCLRPPVEAPRRWSLRHLEQRLLHPCRRHEALPGRSPLAQRIGLGLLRCVG
jgi:CubicO group peptidase (beta-lactamase class C family)